MGNDSSHLLDGFEYQRDNGDDGPEHEDVIDSHFDELICNK
jgi:hypothetical protein